MNDDTDYLVKTEKDALHAMNLSKLLSKSWIEYPNAYRVCSNIREKDQKRVKEILDDNRYR